MRHFLFFTAVLFSATGTTSAADLAPFDLIPAMSMRAESAVREGAPYCAICYVAGMEIQIDANSAKEATSKASDLCLKNTGVGVHTLAEGVC